MAWFFLRRGVDLLIVFVLFGRFEHCDGVVAAVAAFDHLNELEKIGAVAALVMLAASLGDCLIKIWRAIRKLFP